MEQKLAKELGIVVCDFSEQPLKELRGEDHTLSGFVSLKASHIPMERMVGDMEVLYTELLNEMSPPIQKHGFGQMKLFLYTEGEDVLHAKWRLYRLYPLEREHEIVY